MITQISKRLWLLSFNGWVARAGGEHNCLVKCGYCIQDDKIAKEKKEPPLHLECSSCAIKHDIKNCMLNGSVWQKWAWSAKNKRKLKYARKILQAIIDDGRKLGYVGEAEEKKIKEV